MRKLIAAINMSLDGYCGHTAMIADDELHQHYTDLLNSGDTILYGRITYQLMESYWPHVVENPTGNKANDEFAVSIDNISKIVFSRTLKTLNWRSARLSTKSLKEEVLDLKAKPGKDMFVGSPSLIAASLNLGLVDEFQIAIHPVILGGGLTLLKNMESRIDLKLTRTKPFGSGTTVFYYEPQK
jgi:dihydrofolate reductase